MKVKLSQYRFKNGKRISQRQLAEAVGVSRATISYLENGRVPDSIITAFKIANYLNVGVEDIFIMPGCELTDGN